MSSEGVLLVSETFSSQKRQRAKSSVDEIDLLPLISRLLNHFMHLKHIRPGKNFRRRALVVSFFKLRAVGPGAKRNLVSPVSQDDVVIAFYRPKNFQADKSRHVLHQAGAALEALFKIRFMTLGYLKAIGYDDHATLPFVESIGNRLSIGHAALVLLKNM
jgi:hypothetical protein